MNTVEKLQRYVETKTRDVHTMIEVRRSPLRTEINPWTLDDSLHEVMLLRGAFVAAIGSIEITLTELAVRASRCGEYAHLRASFPTRRPDRIRYLENVASEAGPLSDYGPIITIIVRRFESALGLRDMLAHGKARVISNSNGEASVQLRDFTGRGEAISERTNVLSIGSLRAAAIKACRFSRAVEWLYARANKLLPPLHE